MREDQHSSVKNIRPWLRWLPAFCRKRLENRDYLLNVIDNTGWQFADNLVRVTIGLLLGIWIARYLGPVQFGLLSFAMAFVVLFSPLAALGLDDIVVRNLVRDPATHEETLGTAFILKLLGGAVSIIAAVSVIFILRPDDDLSQGLVMIISAGGIFQAFNVIEFWFNSQVQAKYIVIARSSAFFLCALIKLGLLLGAAPLHAFAWVAAFELLAGALTLIAVYQRQGLELRRWVFRPAMAKNLLRDSWPLILSCIVISIYLRIDQVMLGEMLGDEAVGVYSVAVRLTEAWLFIPTAVYWSVLPSLVEAKESGDEIFYQRLQTYYNLMALTAYSIAIPMTFFAKGLVVTLFGAAYESAGLMLAVMIWANLFTFLELARSAFFNVMNWNRIYFVTLALGALLNLALNWLLIPRYGGLGAAIATCLSYWFAAHGSCFFYRPLHKTAMMLTRAMIYPRFW